MDLMRPKMPDFDSFRARFSMIEESRVYSNYGPQVTELEERFASRYGVGSAQVAVLANATLALEGLIRLSNVSEWFIPSWTFVATALAASNSGRDFAFRDVDLSSQVMEMSPETLDSSIATLPFGSAIPGAWWDHGFPALIDGAASSGNIDRLEDLPDGTSLVISLHATKYLGCGEGAVVISGSSSVISELRSWSNFGFDKHRTSIRSGTNAKMSEFQAAICHCVLDEEARQRDQLLYARGAANEVAESLGIRDEVADGLSPYWQVRFATPTLRETARLRLAESDIPARSWWGSGCHRMPFFKNQQTLGALENTEHLALTTLGLPFHSEMTNRDFEKIQSSIAGAISS